MSETLTAWSSRPPGTVPRMVWPSTSMVRLVAEMIPAVAAQGIARFNDIFCETESGEHIIVEMQNRWQEHFQDRALFYMSKSIVSQGVRSTEWNYELTAVYGVFFTNFLLDREQTDHFCRDVMLIDRHTGKVFNRKFRQIYIELPRFLKRKEDCENFFEYWIYNLINMNKMDEISFKDKQEIFSRLEKVASQANLSDEDRARYEAEWKIYNDYFNTIESAKKRANEEGREEGRAEGRAEEQLKLAKGFKEAGTPISVIAKVTGLSIEAIEAL